MEQSGKSIVKSASVRRVMRHHGKPVLEMELEYPKISDNEQAKLGSFYRNAMEAWRSRWEKEVFPLACAAFEQDAQMQPWQMSYRYHVSYESDELLSIYTDASEQYGKQHPLFVRNAETWSLRDGMPRTLYSFFPEQRFPRTWLLRKLIEQAAAQKENGEHLLDPQYARLMHRCFDPACFYLTEDALVIYYPLESIAPYAEGLPCFFLPCLISETSQSDDGIAN